MGENNCSSWEGGASCTEVRVYMFSPLAITLLARPFAPRSALPMFPRHFPYFLPLQASHDGLETVNAPVLVNGFTRTPYPLRCTEGGCTGGGFYPL